MATATDTAASAPRPLVQGRTLAARTAILAACLGVAAIVASVGAGVRLSRTDPGLAAQLAPFDARAATAAAKAALDHGTSPSAPRVRRLVRTALQRDLTLPAAIELRGLDAQASGDHRREARLFELSGQVSRRSLATRLWLIQRSVDRGDARGALTNFDIALRTSTDATDVLFPVLARASEDPALGGDIAGLLDRPGDWRLPFLHYAVTEAHEGVGVAGVVLRMRDRRTVTEHQVDQAVVGELVSEGQFALARLVQDAFHAARAETGPVRDADFSDPKATYPFGWELTQSGEVGAVRAVVAGRPALSYQTSPGGSGPAAVQLLTLPPGPYRLTTATAAADQDPLARPYWTLTCGEDGGAQIALLPQAGPAGASAGVDFAVPPDCPGQWLVLHLIFSDRPDRTGAIASVSIARR